MEKKKILIIIGIVVFVVILITIVLICLNITNKDDEVAEENEQTENIVEEETEANETLIVGLDKEEVEEETTQEEVVETKSASQLTQEIYDINGVIGTLNIPKTGLTTQIYSNVTVDQMEIMPCFLYTTGGLNEVGVTLFVGHNRENGLLFSNNDLLEEGDVFYFTDLNGEQKTYTVYSKFVTTDDDVSFLQEETDVPVIALSCCVDSSDTDMRTIILGRAE